MEESRSTSGVCSIRLAGTIGRPSGMIKSICSDGVFRGQSLCDNQPTAHKRFGLGARIHSSGGTTNGRSSYKHAVLLRAVVGDGSLCVERALLAYITDVDVNFRPTDGFQHLQIEGEAETAARQLVGY